MYIRGERACCLWLDCCTAGRKPYSTQACLQSRTSAPSASGTLWIVKPALPRASVTPVIFLFHCDQQGRLLGLRRTPRGWEVPKRTSSPSQKSKDDSGSQHLKRHLACPLGGFRETFTLSIKQGASLVLCTCKQQMNLVHPKVILSTPLPKPSPRVFPSFGYLLPII